MRIIKKNERKELLFLKQMPSQLKYTAGEVPHYRIGENLYECSCLKCCKPKCLYFEKDEVHVNSIGKISIDENRKVCPVSAIKLTDDMKIEIDRTLCINCGICASRCPAGAIYFDENSKINVNNSMNENLLKCEFDSTTEEKHETMIKDLSQKKKVGIYLSESREGIRRINDELYKFNHGKQNLFVRNLLIALGCNALISREGDVYTRLDGIYESFLGNSGVVEIEFEKDTLGAVRNVLDDIAVLHSRYNFNKNKNYSLVVCLQLPNERQGYWQVVKDIKRVEKIEINTITVGALLIMMWNNVLLDLKTLPFYTDYDNKTIREALERSIDRKVKLSIGSLGILEPIK